MSLPVFLLIYVVFCISIQSKSFLSASPSLSSFLSFLLILLFLSLPTSRLLFPAQGKGKKQKSLFASMKSFAAYHWRQLVYLLPIFCIFSFSLFTPSSLALSRSVSVLFHCDHRLISFPTYPLHSQRLGSAH